ncbi:NAD(P)/FAD-dependent oxidoreductase [Haloarcula sp. CBA1130]|uniref:NAD(P)/FAD-dependent oxidoreductase n=1 Tax=unclassified Haloarcula TaxID=2624677 RepID=UPI0012441214|nr:MULTISPECIES: NAD(P)/FAD-dependent oxidoreductase [unclassified Haloarcula]KAA9395968.1 NAD(P)/FAD-dependent oxidoreductase [Haloarcula sp. CBA1129]KAA9400502.1 NAD(P)/FAD-dependent oxidoreductase [Haloarcula sp. CBA1130]
MATTGTRTETSFDHDVIIVGGGPAGCSAGVFTARADLDTVIYDRGRSSLKRCAYLENYLGFPAGIDIETLYDRIQDHAETAGCTIVSELVESLDRTAGGAGFVVETQDGETATSRRVIAATRYDGEYMRGLDDDAAMFETIEHDGEEHETFDSGYADADGTTPVPRLYVASPSEAADMQAIIAAGRGARVARRVITDTRTDDGWWESAADGVDWVRREVELDDEWTDRATWVDYFDDRYAEDAPVEPDSARFRRVRDAVIDERRSSYITSEEIATRTETGQETLAGYLDPEAVVSGLDQTAVLDAMDDERIRDYLGASDGRAEVSE